MVTQKLDIAKAQRLIHDAIEVDQILMLRFGILKRSFRSETRKKEMELIESRVSENGRILQELRATLEG